MSPEDALREAEERGLTWWRSRRTPPPVCRILDFGKYKYQQSKRAKESKKHQHVVTVKEFNTAEDRNTTSITDQSRTGFFSGQQGQAHYHVSGREMSNLSLAARSLARVVEATTICLTNPPDASRAPSKAQYDVMLRRARMRRRSATRAPQAPSAGNSQEAEQEAGRTCRRGTMPRKAIAQQRPAGLQSACSERVVRKPCVVPRRRIGGMVSCLAAGGRRRHEADAPTVKRVL